MTPLVTLEQAVAEFGGQVLVLRPPASEREIEHLRREWRGPLPEDLVSLLRRTSGVEFEPLETELDFLGSHPFEIEDAFPRALPLLGDGLGNHWVMDPFSGQEGWGAVFYVCHDPGAIVVQASTLAQFLDSVFDLRRASRRSALALVQDDVVFQLSRTNPYLATRAQSMGSGDRFVSDFAAGLPEDFKVADLRTCEVGIGFAFDPGVAIRRAGHELVFGVEAE